MLTCHCLGNIRVLYINAIYYTGMLPSILCFFSMLLQVKVKAGLHKFVYMRGNDVNVVDDVGAGKTLDIYLRSEDGRPPLINLLRIPPNAEPELNSHAGRVPAVITFSRCTT